MVHCNLAGVPMTIKPFWASLTEVVRTTETWLWLTDSVPWYKTTCASIKESYKDSEPVTPVYGTPMFISEPLSLVCGTESIDVIRKVKAREHQ